MKTSGLVLDFYDDKSGGILRDVCPTPDRLPEAVKTAHILSPQEREVLRDEAYALILHNDGQQLRKFACVDEGNTVLSTLYFMETFDRLPPEAVKVAAQNLAAFNEEFGLPVPHLLKLAAATGMSRKRDTMNQPLVGDEADWAARTNLVSTRGGSDAGRVIPTVNQMKTAAAKKEKKGPAYGKGALIGGGIGGAIGLGAAGIDHHNINKALAAHAAHLNTHRAAIGGELADAVGAAAKSTAKKGIRNNYLLGGSIAIPGALMGAQMAHEHWKKKQQTKTSSVVDVSALTPEFHMKNKVAQRTALDGRFSLDSYSDVLDAIDYFSESWPGLDPDERHQFSVKTAARAEELSIEVPELMQRYGSTEYAPDVDAHLANRRAVAPQFEQVWNDLQEKRAMIEPESFASLLQEADELVGLNFEWGGSVMDPFYATFGGRSETEKLAWAWEGADGDKIDEEGLKSIPRDQLAANFTPDFVEAFNSDPVTIFESMPDQHKVLISRMV